MIHTESRRVSTGEEFRPDPGLKPVYIISMLLILVLGVCWWAIPLAIFGEGAMGLVIGALLLVFFIFYVIWVQMYYRSIAYCLTEDEITWQRGVWFRKTGIVPYSRITNVDIVQGPLMRFFGISSLKIQTAGYSTQTQSEIKIEGSTEPKALRDLIMGYVRGTTTIDTGDRPAERKSAATTEDEILTELRAIRNLLENHRNQRENTLPGQVAILNHTPQKADLQTRSDPHITDLFSLLRLKF